jgi:hypothetical protein
METFNIAHLVLELSYLLLVNDHVYSLQCTYYTFHASISPLLYQIELMVATVYIGARKTCLTPPCT